MVALLLWLLVEIGPHRAPVDFLGRVIFLDDWGCDADVAERAFHRRAGGFLAGACLLRDRFQQQRLSAGEWVILVMLVVIGALVSGSTVACRKALTAKGIIYIKNAGNGVCGGDFPHAALGADHAGPARLGYSQCHYHQHRSGAVFFLSDSMLAWNRFVTPISYGRLKVIITYHLGQILIALGRPMQFMK